MTRHARAHCRPASKQRGTARKKVLRSPAGRTAWSAVGECQNQWLPIALPIALPCSPAKARLACVTHIWRQAHTAAYGRWGQRTCQRLDELEALSQEVYNRVHARVGQ